MSDATSDLLVVLRRECAVLERHALAVTSLQLLLAVGEPRFVGTAVDEVEALRDAIGGVEVARAVATSRLAEELGLDGDDATLDELAAVLPEESAVVLRELGTRARAITERVTATGAVGLALAEQRLAATRGALTDVDALAPAPGYDGSGSRALSAALPPVAFDSGA